MNLTEQEVRQAISTATEPLEVVLAVETIQRPQHAQSGQDASLQSSLVLPHSEIVALDAVPEIWR